MPKLPYVDWNTDDADQAIRALEQAAIRLENSADDRSRHAQAAGVEWAGAHREKFSEHIRIAVSRGRDMAQDYRRCAQRIRTYNDEAQRLNEQRKKEETLRYNRDLFSLP